MLTWCQGGQHGACRCCLLRCRASAESDTTTRGTCARKENTHIKRTKLDARLETSCLTLGKSLPLLPQFPLCTPGAFHSPVKLGGWRAPDGLRCLGPQHPAGVWA